MRYIVNIIADSCLEVDKVSSLIATRVFVNKFIQFTIIDPQPLLIFRLYRTTNRRKYAFDLTINNDNSHQGTYMSKA
ncbi:hypothetical protein KSF78_0006911 [Schistosoma japonicum]|nr:hypothetical protein KSF78_0006911 [Schistosoma japonicum]